MNPEVMTQTNNTITVLESATKQNTEFMTLKGNIYNAKIVYIYDGDTLHVVFKEFDKFYRWNCRIMRVDTPELRTKNLKEKELGYKVRDALIERFMDKIVKIKCDEFDKYGRLLIDVFVPNDIEENDGNLMLSQWLINNKYAYEYDGGTKKSWDNL
jgi:endonuclease YncB( thermonuclease family)